MKKHDFSSKRINRCAKSGVTMIELLIVVAILGILLFLLIFTTFRQVSKGRDGKRKADLEQIKVAFEDYFNDNDCYPNPDDWVLYECDSDDFKPYLSTIPCDPLTKELYLYVPSEDDVCNGYRMLAKLENSDDPSVTSVGCDADGGCGYVGDAAYNYGVAQGVAVYMGEGGGGEGGGEEGEPTNAIYCVKSWDESSSLCSYLVISVAESWGCSDNFGSGLENYQICLDECTVDTAECKEPNP